MRAREPARGKRRILRVGFRLSLYYLCLVGLAYFLQNWLLYHPPRLSLEQVEQSAAAVGLRLWPGVDGEYRGLTSGSGLPPGRPVVAVFHGNAGSASDRDHYVVALEPLGYSVLLLEYPGFGARAGKLSEPSFVADALASLQRAIGEAGAPIFLMGESLGAAVAASVAGTGEVPVAGIGLITPWDTLPNLAQSLYWFLPARLLVRDRYDSVANLGRYGGPVAVLMAERDEIIPNRHTLALYESLPGPKRLWVFPGATHNRWPREPDAGWWKEVMAFLSEATGSRESGIRNR